MITAMKKFILLISAAIIAAGAMQAKTADELRVYLNPGHGSWGPNDRPMATIPYPNLPETGMPDTCGFYETNTNLWKILRMGKALENMGVKHENIMYSRVQNGPYPYTKDNYDPDEIYNRPLSAICREVDANNMDIFVSIHSNAASDGTTTNYPLFLYRGSDGENGDSVAGSRNMCLSTWGPHYMDELDPQSYYSRTSSNVRGDISFYGSSYTTTTSKGTFRGYLGVLRHGTPGFLMEGYFHTYQPARHRALNKDYCGQEGIRTARGVAAYFGLKGETTGYIMGTVKDLHEKIVNSLFHYAPNTNDQWLPINGAKVTLYKGSTAVKTYDVDTLYNGIFVFENLEPGTYTLRATASGYKEQGTYTESTVNDEYKDLVATSMGDYTVTANATTYAKLYLESQSYVPPTVTYENYPDPVQPAYLKLPDSFKFGEAKSGNLKMAGTVKRAIVRGDSTVILTNEGTTPHLYLVNNTTKSVVKELSTQGITAVDAENAGDYSALNDIAFTADGQLVGVNSVLCQYSDAQVDAGYKRGTVRFYKWASLDADPALWQTTQSSTNFYRAIMGRGLGVSGPADDCKLITTGTTTGTSTGSRMLVVSINDNVITSTVFTENTITNGNFSTIKNGVNKQLVVSPYNDGNFVIDGESCLPQEFTPAATNNTNSTINSILNDTTVGKAATGIQFFKYAKHALMVTPAVDGNNVIGLKLYNVDGGLDKATLLGTATIAAATNAATLPVVASGAAVKGEDINLYLFADTTMYSFSTSDVEQPLAKGVFAYALSSTESNDSYKLTYSLTDASSDVNIVLTPANADEQPITIPMGSQEKGTYTCTVDKSQLALNVKYNWNVDVQNKAIPTVKTFFTSTNNTARGVAIDLNPESQQFGNIYISDPYGTKGIYFYAPDGTPMSTTPYITDVWNSNTASPFRLAVDPANSHVYSADWSDAHAGLWGFNPVTRDGVYNFFNGTTESSGRILNGDVVVGGGTTGASFFGTGNGTKLVTFVEDYPTGNNGQTLCLYNVGTDSTWNAAPSKTFPTVSALMANTNVNIYADSLGMWVAQVRGSGNNGVNVPSFVYADYDDNVLFNSGNLDADTQDGSWGAGLVMSADRSKLAVCTGKPNINVYNITWTDNKPALALDYVITYPADARGQNILNQMAFDYAGNLYVANRYQSYGFTMPKDAQVVATPAAQRYYLINTVNTGVNDVTAAKTVKNVQYVNAAGMISNKPFEGVNIVITNYTDGTKSVKKVMK